MQGSSFAPWNTIYTKPRPWLQTAKCWRSCRHLKLSTSVASSSVPLSWYFLVTTLWKYFLSTSIEIFSGVEIFPVYLKGQIYSDQQWVEIFLVYLEVKYFLSTLRWNISCPPWGHIFSGHHWNISCLLWGQIFSGQQWVEIFPVYLMPIYILVTIEVKYFLSILRPNITCPSLQFYTYYWPVL